MDGLSESLYEQLLANQKKDINSFNLCTVKDQLVATSAADEDAAMSDEEIAVTEASADTASTLDGGLAPVAKSAAASESTEASIAGETVSDKEEDVQEMRLQARAAIMGALRADKLRDALHQARVETLQKQVRNTFVGAVRNGTLHKVLEEETEKKQAAQPKGLPKGVETMQQLKQMATQRLLKAATDGRLQTALVGAREALRGTKEDTEEDKENITTRARRTMLNSARGTGLHEALRQEKKEALRARARSAIFNPPAAAAALEPEKTGEGQEEGDETKNVEKDARSLKRQARAALVSGIRDGRLLSVMGELGEKRRSRQDAKREELRQQAMATLLGGARRGSLEEGLRQVRSQKDSEEEEDNLEQLRLEARNTIAGAVDSGKLLEVLMRTRAEANLRREVGASLVAGAMNGKLFAALKQASNKHQPEEDDEQDEEAEDTTVNLDEVKLRARDALEKALLGFDRDTQEKGDEPTAQDQAALDAVKLRARDALGKALLGSGSAEKKSQPPAQDEKALEAVKLRARDALAKALLGDDLDAEEESQPAAQDEDALEALKLSARDALAKALLGKGSAEEKKSQPPIQDEDALEALKLTARDALAKALLGNSSAEEMSQPPAQEPTVEDMRRRLRDVFSGAAKSGALLDVMKRESLESLRTQAKHSLLKAAVDGCLPMAFEQLARAGPSAAQPEQQEQAAKTMVPKVVLELPIPTGGPLSASSAGSSSKRESLKIRFSDSIESTNQEVVGACSPTSQARPTPRPTSSSATKSPKHKHESTGAGSKPPSREGKRSSSKTGSKPLSREGGRFESKMQPPAPAFENPRAPPTLVSSASDSALPGFGLAMSTSRSSSRLRAASMAASAMAMDLGAPPPDAARAAAMARPPSQQFALRPSASAGSLRLTKSSTKLAPVLLPSLAKMPALGGGIAYSPAAADRVQPVVGGGREAFWEAADWSLGGRSSAKWDISRAIF